MGLPNFLYQKGAVPLDCSFLPITTHFSRCRHPLKVGSPMGLPTITTGAPVRVNKQSNKVDDKETSNKNTKGLKLQKSSTPPSE